MTEGSQHEFMKGQSFLTKRIAFYNDLTSWMRREQQMVISTLKRLLALTLTTSSQTTYWNRLTKWTVRYMENWLNCHAQRVVESSTNSSWRLVTTGVLRGLILGQYYLTSSLITWMMGQNAPLTSLQEMQDWEEWLMTCSVVPPFRGTCMGGTMFGKEKCSPVPPGVEQSER